MFAMVLPLPRTSISLGAGLVCFLAHAGSASMASGLRVGGVPVKVTVPVTDEAAKATLGQSEMAAIDAAARHNRVPVLRIVGSLVIANLVFPWSPLTKEPTMRRTGTRLCLAAAS